MIHSGENKGPLSTFSTWKQEQGHNARITPAYLSCFHLLPVKPGRMHRLDSKPVCNTDQHSAIRYANSHGSTYTT